MSCTASGSQIIFADTDGLFDASFATWAVLVGPATVVGLDEVPELLPHAARSDAQATDAMATVRSCTSASYRPTPATIGRDGGLRRSGDSVRRVRRPVVLAFVSGLVSTAVVVLAGNPASAHICPVAAQIPVGTTATVNVGVTVEQATVPDVEITVPSGLRLDRTDPKPGWTVVRRGPVLRYHGGPITPFTCAYFPIGVTASERGSFGIPVVQRDTSGKIVARSTPDPSVPADRLLDQFVYAGVKPPSPPGTSKGPSGVVIAGIVLVGGGLIAAGVGAWRSRRRRDDDDEDAEAPEDRDAELRARLERFRTRAPDRTSGS
jgi:hypothetical protein